MAFMMAIWHKPFWLAHAAIALILMLVIHQGRLGCAVAGISLIIGLVRWWVPLTIAGNRFLRAMRMAKEAETPTPDAQ